ncbi:MAG: hypothetical protein AVDCRST_MAG18-3684, partial [uncultured Thermomicrobiales bacterium]
GRPADNRGHAADRRVALPRARLRPRPVGRPGLRSRGLAAPLPATARRM